MSKQQDRQSASGAHAQHLIAPAAVRLPLLQSGDAVVHSGDQRLHGPGLLIAVVAAQDLSELPEMADAAHWKGPGLPDQRRLHDLPRVRCPMCAQTGGIVREQLPQLPFADRLCPLTQLLRGRQAALDLAEHQLQHPLELPQLPVLGADALRHADPHRTRRKHDQRRTQQFDHS